MKWFRFYSEFRHDSKIKRMPIAHRYAFVVLLCLANEGSVRGVISSLDDEDLAFELEMEVEDWQTLKAKFVASGLASLGDKGELIISDWEYNQKHRDRPPLDVWKQLRATVFDRDNYTCQYCGAYGTSLQCDHVIPVSRGGSNELSNLATACKPCNLSKHAKTPEEWLGEFN